MIIKKGWEKRFAKSINKEMKSHKKNQPKDTKDIEIISGMKDAVYLLGQAMNPEQYKFHKGFERFLTDIGITEMTA